MIQKIVFPLVCALLLYSCAVFNRHTKTAKTQATSSAQTTGATNTDTTQKTPKPKLYKDVITPKAITEHGFFKVHKVDTKYYFEVPDSLLERDILIVTRVAKAAAEGLFDGGDDVGERLVRFSRGPKDKIFLKQLSYRLQANDSTENGMYKSLQNSNLQPIIASFDAVAYLPDSSGVVIDITKFLDNDNEIFYFAKGAKKYGQLGALDPERSYVAAIKAYPINIEITAVKTYNSSVSTPFTYELNSSIVLLPKTPMKSRIYDGRVGYFYREYGDFDRNPQGYEVPLRINRWRLEPKPEDVEKYKRGELVEPAKPIVYYIDPATPKKWVPYLIQGINDWKKAFEKAGFKNAIYALEAPTNDPSWSLFDATHNAIIYKASGTANAAGPHVQDPRSGEILETHIEWYHNVMSLLHDWYMIQAGSNDPRARNMQYDDKLMGQLIRFVSSHEVGHTLGLQHNFGASSTIPVEKLRDKKWVEENGFCPSIMDYARFNYVAQPEDNISEKGIFPRIGVYDEFAIEWGYRWFDQFKTNKEEETYLNKWVIQKTTADARLFFGSQVQMGMDSRCQSEDLGDDAVLASEYGIKNLKRILPQLPEWTKETNEKYHQVYKGMRNQLVNQYKRYIYHVARNIGGINYNERSVDQLPIAKQITPTPVKLQKAAIRFLSNELFVNEPEWLQDFNKNTKCFSMIGGLAPQYEFAILKDTLLGGLININRLIKLSWFEYSDPENAYPVKEYLKDLETNIWENLAAKRVIGMYERFTEQSYVTKLKFLLGLSPNDLASYTDLGLEIRLHAQSVYKRISDAIPNYKDEVTKIHLQILQKKLKLALNGVPAQQGAENSKNKKEDEESGFLKFQFDINSLLKKNSAAIQFENCWKDDVFGSNY